MTTVQAVAGQVAGGLALLATVPYVRAILRGETRPNIATWFIWTGVGVLLLSSYWAGGARAAIWVAVANVAGPFVIAVLSLRYGERGLTRLDVACLAVAAASIALWIATGDPRLALVLNLVVDLAGAVPTIGKTWRDPSSEDRLAWGLFLAANAVNLLAVEAWTFAGALYPLYLFVLTIAMNGLLRRRPRAAAEDATG